LLRLSTIAFLSFLGTGACGQAAPSTTAREDSHYGFAAGQPVRANAKASQVDIVFSEVDGRLNITPRQLKFTRGQTVKFSLRNDTNVKHEFVLGSVAENLGHAQSMQLSPDFEHHEVNGRVLKSKSSAMFHWRFTRSGTFEFACLVPGHADSEMRGQIVVD
jgi:uncharacterized cupredoxin-like copper-binding protein